MHTSTSECVYLNLDLNIGPNLGPNTTRTTFEFLYGSTRFEVDI